MRSGSKGSFNMEASFSRSYLEEHIWSMSTMRFVNLPHHAPGGVQNTYVSRGYLPVPRHLLHVSTPSYPLPL